MGVGHYRNVALDSRSVNRLDFFGVVGIVGNVEAVLVVSCQERGSIAVRAEFDDFRIGVIAVVVAVGNDFVFGVFDGDCALADREDNVVAADRDIHCVNRGVGEEETVFRSVVDDNVVAVA